MKTIIKCDCRLNTFLLKQQSPVELDRALLFSGFELLPDVSQCFLDLLKSVCADVLLIRQFHLRHADKLGHCKAPDIVEHIDGLGAEAKFGDVHVPERPCPSDRHQDSGPHLLLRKEDSDLN